MFPVYGSVVLFSIYLLYKIIDKQLLSVIFTVHFMFLGIFCLAQLLEEFVGKLFPPHFSKDFIIKKKLDLNLRIYRKVINVEFTRMQFICFALAFIPTSIYITNRHWIANNIFGIAFSVVGIKNLTLPSFQVGFILLWGLFFYDIFWVYGTDVMITVAKSFDAPIKLMFPYKWDEVPPKFSMLGLGDIVIPGIFVSLCLKFDVDKRIAASAKNIHAISTPYFNCCFVGYIIGLISTFAAMEIF